MLTASPPLFICLKAPHILTLFLWASCVNPFYCCLDSDSVSLFHQRRGGGPQQPKWLINIQAVYVSSLFESCYCIERGGLCRLTGFFQIFQEVPLGTRCWRNLWALSSGWVRAAINHFVAAAESTCVFFYASVFCVFLCLCRRSCTASTRCCPQSTSVGAACWSNGSTSQFSRSAGRTEQRWRVRAGPPLTKPSVHHCSFSWWFWYFIN